MTAENIGTGRVSAPWHLWVVGIVSLLWNGMGAFDYLMTQSKAGWYMSQFTQEQLAYFDSFPVWADAAWALGVWGAALGSLALLMRRTWAAWLFGLSLIGLLFTTIYNFVLTDGAAQMGEGAFVWLLSAMIWLVTIALFFYSRWLSRRGILT